MTPDTKRSASVIFDIEPLCGFDHWHPEPEIVRDVPPTDRLLRGLELLRSGDLLDSKR